MSQNDIQDDQLDPQQEGAEEPLDNVQEESENRKKLGMFGGWGISFAVHTGAIALAALAVFASPTEEIETPPVRVNTIDPPAKEKEKPKERTLEAKVELDVNATSESDQVAPVSQLDVPVDNAESESEMDSPVAKGREEAVADAEAGGSGAFMAIGAGGGSAGMFGSRSGGGKKRALNKGGGSKGSEGAVNASLMWFKRHQDPSGMWDAVNYYKNCTEGQKCEPGELDGGGDINVAMTGYAVLAFLGAGYDHKTPNKFKPTVKKGLDYLLSCQKEKGRLGARNYENAVAAMALAEAYAMTTDPELKEPTQRAIDSILACQNQEPGGKDTGYGRGLGWNYNAPAIRNDSSVTGWQIMALKSALAAGLNVGNGMTGAKRWLELHWQNSNHPKDIDKAKGEKSYKEMTPYDMSKFLYVWNSDEEGNPKEGSGAGRESIGLVSAVFLGHLSGDLMAETLANTVMAKQMPKSYPTNTYYMYYNTMGIFQMGGERWKTWNATVRDMLVNAQRKSNDCFDGSWDWEGTKFHGHKNGRVLSTAYNTLCLEVYYRYAQVAKGK